MKKSLICSLLLCCLMAVSAGAYAQKLTKEEKAQAKEQAKKEKAEVKAWKKKLKEVKPLEYRDMVEETQVLRSQVGALKSQVESLTKEKDAVASSLSAKDETISQLESKVRELEAKATDVSVSGSDWTKGVVYKVQVGAFRNKDLSKFHDSGNFWVEDQDGVKKYTIAHFRDYNEAEQFKKYMREMGVKDAWIVAYVDNVRKDINDALQSQKNAPAAEAAPAAAPAEQPRKRTRKAGW